MARKFAAVVFSLGCIHASSTYALGLGDLKLESFLNEPLNAHVDLLNIDDLHADQIRVRLASKDDFDRMDVERAYFLTSIKFEISRDERGRASIAITSDDPVLEPYLDFIVEARWPTGRLLREYTVLVDPPLFDETTTVVSASARVAELEGLPNPNTEAKKSQGPAASSGTRVGVKNKSNLSAGDMPDRDFNSKTSAAPLSGGRYMIHRDDTLWEIASSAKPQGASVHQTMLDIQRMNPNAFIGGNINRIKAGYIIYLPQEGDISSANIDAARAEVRLQNDDWEAGRASKPLANKGPSLRISADSDDSARDTSSDPYSAGVSGAAAGDELARSDLAQSEVTERLVAMEQRVDTLQRIVSVKDDQIAALQQALAAAGGAIDLETSADIDSSFDPQGDTDIGGAELSEFDDEADTELQADKLGRDALVEDDSAAVVAEAKPVAKKKPTVTSAPPEENGLISYLLYGLGALILAALAFFFVRRRKDNDQEVAERVMPAADVFADVKLKEQPVEADAELEATTDIADEIEEEAPSRDNRGYGERKHDEYASDTDTGDALAEADIYIAYGRYPQAVDLLKNALISEPHNPAFRLKLLEMYVQMDDNAAAESEMRELEAINDPASLDRAREVLGGGVAMDTFAQPPSDLAEEVDGSLESDFAALEIETDVDVDDLDEDLDLSSDFGDDVDDEDLVIAAEANSMSTKLDLARAYLDMGDDDGARQILDEVVAEGSEAQKTEAGELLDRIG